MDASKWEGKNPWLGLSTYQEGSRLYGRDAEVSTLMDIICNNLASVVFGRSGIGKSSLIHAGISPEIRKRGMMPIYIRFEHNTNSSYIQQIEKAICNELEKEDQLGEQVPQMGLWDFFHRNIFFNRGHQQTIPVIIIDQFEEIYTLADADHKYLAQELFEELADLLNNIRPARVIAYEDEASRFTKSKVEFGNDDVLTFRIHSKKRLGYTEDSNFHLVICLREDYLYYLERNTSKIPAFKVNRFSLQALDRLSAKEVIMRPRLGLFSENEADDIITKISTFNDEGHEEIDPTILSIFLFKYYNRKGHVSTDNIISEFYADETKGITVASLSYLEDHLITGEGFRHFSPYNDAISSGVKEEELEKLIASRILTVETRKGHRYLEFSHDVICPIVKSNREQRKLDEQARKLKKRIFAATGLVFLALILIGVYLQQDYYLQVSKTKNASIRAHYMIVQGDVLDAIKLLLNVAPSDEGWMHQKVLPETEKALNEAYDSLYSDYSCIAILNHQDDVNTAEFSEDSKQIITSCSDGVCRIWNSQSGELQVELKGDSKEMTGASLSKDGDRAITSYADGTVDIWDVTTGDILSTLKGHALSVSYACFSPDGKFALTSSNDKTVKLWNAQMGEFIETIVVHQDNVECALFNSDGTKVITSSEDGSVVVYDMRTQTPQKIFEDKLSVEYAEYNDDGSKIAIVTKNAVYVKDVTERQNADLVLNGNEITSATFSPDGKTIAVSSREKTITLWDITQEEPQIIHVYRGHSNIVTDVVFSPDGRFLVSTSSDNEARLWNVASRHRDDIIHTEMDVLAMVTYSPDGKYIAAISSMGKAKVWDADSKTLISTFSIPERANSIVFNRTSEKVVIASYESSVLRIYNVLSGEKEDSIEVEEGITCDYALFAESDNVVLAYSGDSHAIRWDLVKGSVRNLVGEGLDSLTCMNFLPGDTTCLLSSATRNAFSLWDYSKKESIRDYHGHAATVYCVRCSHDGQSIISGSSDNTAMIWNLKSGNIVRKLKRHSSQVYFAEYSPDDRYVITASDDETVMLWNTTNGEEVATRKATECAQYANIFSPNGRHYIVPNGADIRIYKLQTPMELIQGLMKRYDTVELTAEEKERYSLK